MTPNEIIEAIGIDPYYREDAGVIYCADCMTILPKMPEKCVDLVVTSPPYNFDEGASLGNKGYRDAKPINMYFREQKDTILSLLNISENGIFYNIQMIAGNKYMLMGLIGELSNVVKEIIIWDKKTAEPAMNDGCLNSQFEFIFIFSRDNKRTFSKRNFTRGTLSNVWRIGKNSRMHIKPCSAIMPIGLALKIISNFTGSDDIILDPFLGSGTTAIAAKQLGRKFIGIEIEEKYCAIAVQRLAQEVMAV